MISLKYEAAEGPLSQCVSSFYRFEYEGSDMRELERADRAQFRFSLRGAGHYEFDGGHTRPSYPVTILGPTTAPVTSVANCNQTILGWGMQPAGWAALMGKDAEKWTNNAFDACDIFGDSILELREKLFDCSPNDNKVFAILRDAANEIFGDLKQAPFEFTRIVDNWLTDNIDHDIMQLVDASGLSQRQLERTTKRFYGAPPKKLARKYRALRAAQMLASGDSLDESEMSMAFYDQSHLVREVKQFTGLTPSQLRSGEAELTKATMKGRKSMTGKVGKLISDS